MKLYVFNNPKRWTTDGSIAIVADNFEDAAAMHRRAMDRRGFYKKYSVEEHEIKIGLVLIAEGYDSVTLSASYPALSEDEKE